MWEAKRNHPHSEVLLEDPGVNRFAIELYSVLRGTAPKVYIDPKEFFTKTHMTRNLKGLLKETLERTQGKTKTPVIVVATVFGGGKTHAILAIYHLFKGKRVVENILKDLLREVGVPSIPEAKVVILDGRMLDPEHGNTRGSYTVRTLWGEVAYQLGLYKDLADSDKSRVTPGSEKLSTLIEKVEKPIIFLLDEIGEYLNKADGVHVGANTLADQTLSFLHEVITTLDSSPNSMLIFTLPSEHDPFRKYTERISKMIEDVRKIGIRLGRVETPIEREEVYDVVKKRLFEEVDEALAEKVANEYWSYYKTYSDYFPEKARRTEYRERIRRSYPIHPELIDLLYERVATIPEFQKTRGLLRLIALIVRDVYLNKYKDAHLVMPHHVNLGDETIANELTAKLARGAFIHVIRTDIISSEGGAKAQLLDARLKNESKAVRTATSLYLYSLIGAARQDISPTGASPADLRLSLVTLEVHPEETDRILEALSGELWYIHEAGGRYFFATEANLNKVIEDFKGRVEPLAAKTVIQERLTKACRHEFFNTQIWADDLPDDEEATLAVVNYEKAYIPCKEGNIPSYVENIHKMAGQSFRINSNSLFFLVADASLIDQVEDAAKERVAIDLIKKDPAVIGTLTKEKATALEAKRSESEEKLNNVIQRAYRHLVYPSTGGLRTRTITMVTTGRTQRLSDVVYKELTEGLGKIVSSLEPSVITDKVTRWKKEKEVKCAWTADEIRKAFCRYTDLPYPTEKDVVYRAIRRGSEGKVFGYVDGDNNLHYGSATIITDDGKLIPGKLAADIFAKAKKKKRKRIIIKGGGEQIRSFPLKESASYDKWTLRTIEVKGDLQAIHFTSQMVSLTGVKASINLDLKGSGKELEEITLGAKGKAKVLPQLRNILDSVKIAQGGKPGEYPLSIVLRLNVEDEQKVGDWLNKLGNLPEGFKELDVTVEARRIVGREEEEIEEEEEIRSPIPLEISVEELCKGWSGATG